MSWVELFLSNDLTGWGAAGLLVAGIILVLVFRRVIPLGTHKEVVGYWQASSDKWEKAAQRLLEQNQMLIGSQEISKKFYTEQLGKDPQTGDKLVGTGGD